MLQNRTSTSIEYFIRFWVRPYSNFNVTNEKQAEVLFDIPGSFRCQLQFQNTLACFKPGSTSQNDFVYLQRVPMTPRMWMHVAVCGQKALNKGFIAVDYSDQQLKSASTGYLKLAQAATPWLVYIGVTSSLLTGLYGDIREFLITEEAVALSQVQVIKNSYVNWNQLHLCYLRLQGGSLVDETRKFQKVSMVSQSERMPVSQYDVAPNDICFPQMDARVAVPLFDNLTFTAVTIDSRMKNLTSNYAYSASIWIKYQGSKQSTSPSTFTQSLAFLQLKGVFSLWFQNFTNGTYARFRLHSSKSTSEKDTPALFISLDEWVNLQLNLDQLKGYDFRVYDVYGKLQSSAKDATALGVQLVGYQFQILQNLKGFAKSITIYQKSIQLPINNTLTTISDDSLLINYDFSSTNYVAKQLQSLAKTLDGTQSQNLSFDGTPVFSSFLVPSVVNFTDGRLYGGLNQTASNYDGLSCNNSLKQLISLKGINASIQFQASLTQNLTEATVELWIKRSLSQTTAAYQVMGLALQFANSSSQRVLQISKEDGSNILTCKIFKNSQSQSTSSSFTSLNLTLDQVDQSRYSLWQHITCGFRLDFEALAFQHGSSGFELIKSMDLSQEPGVYYGLGVVQGYIGNYLSNGSSSDQMTVREVRFWNQSRSLQQVRAFIYTQVNYKTSSGGLLSYFRMASGDLGVQNFFNLDSQVITTNGVDLVSDQNPPLLCPLNSFQYSGGQNCMRNAFQKSLLSIFALLNQSAGTVSWLLTAKYSDTYSPYSLSSDFTYSWLSNNKTVTALISSLSSSYSLNESLVIPNTFINTTTVTTVLNTNGTTTTTVSTAFTTAQHQVFVKTTNAAKSFIQTSIGQFKFNPCRYLQDLQTQNISVVSLVSQDEIGQKDLVFQFKAVTLNGCTLFSMESLLSSASLDIYPSSLNIAVDIPSQDANSGVFTLNFTKQEQLKLQLFQPVTFLLSLYWGNSTTSGSFVFLDPQPETQLNMVYQVRFIRKIEPRVQLSSPYPQVDEEFRADASSSCYANDSYVNGNLVAVNSLLAPFQNVSGINYWWDCPAEFQEVCNRQQGLKVIKISSSEFSSSGAVINLAYTFNLTLRSQMDLYDDQDSLFTTSFQAIWVKFTIPDFALTLLKKSKVYLLEDNVIQLTMNNYLSQTQLLSFTWSLTPNAMSPSLVQLNIDSTIMTILAGGLIANTNYTLSVFVQNKWRSNQNATKTFQFSTGVGNLIKGSLNVNPSEGVADLTYFQIGIQDFKSDYDPITYSLYGLQDQYSPRYLIKQSQAQSTIFNLTLPYLQIVQVQVNDSIGNSFTLVQAVSIQVNQEAVVVTQQMDAITTQMYEFFSQLEQKAEDAYNISLQQGDIFNQTLLDYKLSTLYSVYLYAINLQLDLDDNLYNKVSCKWDFIIRIRMSMLMLMAIDHSAENKQDSKANDEQHTTAEQYDCNYGFGHILETEAEAD